MSDDATNTETTSPAPEASEIENLRAEKNALYEKLARATADFQNTRKRLEADVDTRVQYQLSKLIDSQLPLIDNLERAIGVDPAKADAATILKGVQLVHDQWIDLLKRLGVETIVPKAGDPFDPHVHQSVMQEPSDLPPGSVTRSAQTGYSLNGKLVRSALVVVAKEK
ncbi:MAG TPA: nucleotide exchange factor GrpE [Tepidisphaeraceae bacterium]